MALPLIAALGAGILGGGRYLMNRADERKAQGLAATAESFLANSTLAQAAPGQAMGILNAIQGELQNDSFLDTGSAARVQSLMDAAMAQNANIEQGQAQAAQQAAIRNFDRSTAVTNQLDQDYNRDLRVFGSVVQPAFRQALSALENPNSADSVAALYNFFNIVEPGGRVTENEDGSFTGIGGSGARLANWFNQMRGEGLSENTREQIISAIWKQYQPQFERAKRQKSQYERDLRRYGQQGLDVRSPVGRLGIDYSLNQAPPAPGPIQVPQGYTTTPPETVGGGGGF